MTGGSEARAQELSVTVQAGGVNLAADLYWPAAVPRAIIIFAHGSGSGRLSPRNRYVAGLLRGRRFAALLFDLLTEEEESVDLRTAEFRFDIALLAERLSAASSWLRREAQTRALPLGYFGASTGAAAALIAAAKLPDEVRAVVSRGGRPDLAGPALDEVRASTLLVVGGDDEPVIEMNRAALERLRCEKKLEIVPEATHLFEESGALEKVAGLACDWFGAHL